MANRMGPYTRQPFARLWRNVRKYSDVADSLTILLYNDPPDFELGEREKLEEVLTMVRNKINSIR